MKKFRIVAAVVAVALGATWALAYNEISPGLAALLAAYAPLSGATFTGPVSAPTISGDVSASTVTAAGNWALTSASTGVRWGHTINVVDDFGAKGDGTTDDWQAIQKAEGMAASGYCTYTQPTLVIIPPTTANTYRISQAIRRCPWVTLQVQSNATTMKCTGDASGTDYTGAINLTQFPTSGCFLSGYVSAGSNLPTLALSGAVAVGSKTVTLATLSDAAKLVVGDQVDIETTAGFSYGGFEPSQVKMALIVAINGSTGVVTLDRSLDFASSSVQLRKLSNGAVTAGWPTQSPQNLVFVATHHSGVIGGRWIAASSTPWYQPLDGGGGCLDCVTAPDETVASTSVGYGNLFQDSYFSVRRADVYGAAFEHAYHSSGNVTNIGVIHGVVGTTGIPQTTWIAAFDEGSHDNTLNIGHIEDYTGDSAPTWLLGGTVTSSGGDATSATVYAPAITAATVNVAGSGYNTSAIGTLTYSGSGCSTNPVLAVSTNASGAIAAVTSIQVPGLCTTLTGLTGTTWTAGGGLSQGSGASFTLTTNPSFTVNYTTVNGDTLSSVASVIAASFNGNSAFTGAGYATVANQANGGPGSIIFTNANATPFTIVGFGANALTAYSRLHDALLISDASRNKVNIGSITGGAITGYPVEINGGAAANEPPTAGNDVTISQSSLLWQNGDVSVGGAGGAGNTVHDGWFHGLTFQPKSFWFQYGVGSNNTIKDTSSDAPGGYPWCDQIDITNAFRGVYSTLTAPRSTVGYAVTQAATTCTFDRVTSYLINKMLAYHADWYGGNVSSSTAMYVATQPSTPGGPEVGDAVHFVLHANLGGTAGAKTGSFSWWCDTLNWSIPASAVGTADVIGDFYHWQANSTRGIIKVFSSAGVTTYDDTSGAACAFGSAFGGAMSVNTTTGSDLIQPFAASMQPYIPTYSTGIGRE